MVLTLLPASAAAFAPRSAPTIVLASRVETWLTQTLKRINRVKRPLNSVPQHFRCLTETLSGASAIWTLASLMLPKAPNSELRKDENPLIAAIFNYQLIHLEAYVVHIDMVSQNEIAFKFTQDTIDALIEYHTDVYSIDTAASFWSWPEKEMQLKKLQEEFKQAVNRFVYRTHVRALEGLEDDGAGELLEGRSEEVKNAIMGLFLPLLPPPPPPIVEAPQLHPISQQQIMGQWWHSSPEPIQEQHSGSQESWRVLGSSPSPSVTFGESAPSSWSSSQGFTETALPSPATAYSLPYSSSGQYYSSPQTTSQTPLPLPSVLAQQCGSNLGMSGYGYGNYGYNNNFMSSFPIHT